MSNASDKTMAAEGGGASTVQALELRKERQRSALIDAQLGDTRVEKFLGQGGMATVYLGRQVQLDREVAVKVLSPKLTRDRAQVDQFFREAKTLAKLEHPNIVTIYSVGQKEGVHFLIMQLIRGGSLRKQLLDRQIFPPDEATAIICHIAEGLREAHNNGIVHRDIKPDNVLVGKGPTYKITDFGLAMMGDDSAFTEGKVVGTPHYISPEQVDAKGVDKRTDIYSLGATFYHLLTGKPPFKGASTIDLLMKHVGEPLVPPHEVNPDVPEALSRVVCRMMAKSPDERYQDAESLLADLAAPERAKAESPAATVLEAEQQPTMLLSGRLEPIETLVQPIKAPAPRSARYGFLLVTMAACALVGAGYGPLETVLADVKSGAANELTAMEQFTLDGFERSVHGLSPVNARARYLELLEAHPELRLPIAARVEALDAQMASERESGVRKLLQEASELRAKQELGPAIDLLRGAGDEPDPAIQKLLGDVEEELEGLGMAWVPAARDVALGEGVHTRSVAELPGFYIQRREVTRGEYASFLAEADGRPPLGWKGKTPKAGSEDLPVTGISFEEATAYAKARGLRLPSADEWEFAARGPEGNPWPWGAKPEGDACNWRRDPLTRPEPVGSRERDTSSFGCSDMAGNAAELVQARDGVWVCGGSYLTRRLVNTRAAFFVDVAADARHLGVGFRCAATTLPTGGGE